MEQQVAGEELGVRSASKAKQERAGEGQAAESCAEVGGQGADDGRWTMDDGGISSVFLTPSSIVHRPSSIVYAREREPPQSGHPHTPRAERRQLGREQS